VVRYTGDAPFSSVEDAFNFLINYDHYNLYGFGRWAVIHKSDSEFAGWCGLKYTPERDEHDIGFRFFKKHWNKGFATESAKACLDYGFRRLGLKTIVGRAMKANTASINVLQKTGMTYWKEEDCGHATGVVYRKDAD
jgi:[ribosomal protein S5]-alanine N-acetyltransferase